MPGNQLDSEVRRRLGAYYTPEGLANWLGGWIADGRPKRVMEPSAGAGALVRAVFSACEERGQERPDTLAFDVDPNAARLLRRELAEHTTVVCSDFLASDPVSFPLVDAVIANPPFTRNHALEASVREHLRATFQVAGAAGLWVYFILHSLRFLRQGGRLGVIVPAAVTFTAYGRQLTERLQANFENVTLFELDTNPDWVGAAEERGAVILASGFGGGPAHATSRARLCVSTGHSRQQERSPDQSSAYSLCWKSAKSLSEIAFLRIGVVTGKNSFFLLTEQLRRQLSISRRSVIPIVTKGRQIRAHRVTEEMLLDSTAASRIWLLAPASERARSIREYFAQITKEEVAATSWLARRSPWWKVHVGAPGDAVLTYMNHLGPRMALLADGITCTNTLHRVYFNDGVGASWRHAAILTLYSTFGQLAAERLGRVYGGGVLKFELGDAKRLPVLAPSGRIGVRVLQELDSLLAKDLLVDATSYADEVLMPSVLGRNWKRRVGDMTAELLEVRVARQSQQE